MEAEPVAAESMAVVEAVVAGAGSTAAVETEVGEADWTDIHWPSA